MTWYEAAARWYLVLVACSWAVAPVVRWLCRGLDDRGASLVRPLGLLLAIYPSWLLASLGVTEYRASLLIVTVAVTAVVGWGHLVRNGEADRRWLTQLLLAEGAALLLFLAYIWLRGYTPQILGTEKPMDVAFLASSARAVSMPPPDPWFAGEPINYYYLGYLVFGSVSRVAQVPVEIGFNLALGTIFSMCGMASFGVAWNVMRPTFGALSAAAAGAFTAFSLLIAGNLYALLRLLRDARETADAWWWDSELGIGWRSSRIVCDGPRTGNLCQFPSVETINEFPFFSFLLGDLHPHLMALPFTIIAVALAWNVLSLGNSTDLGTWQAAVRFAVSGIAVGALYPLNAWDLPTFGLICAAAAVASNVGATRRALINLAVFGGAAIVAWLPFVLTYDAPLAAETTTSAALARIPLVRTVGVSFAVHPGPYTEIGEYLTIFGVPYTVGLLVLVTLVRQGANKRQQAALRTVALVATATVPVAVLLQAPLLALCGVPLTLAIAELAEERQPSPRTFVLCALSAAWLLSIGVEFIYVQDLFANRMNTLFKFYYQAWSLYALAAGPSLLLIWNAVRARVAGRALVVGLATAALVAGLAYPVVASLQWTERLGQWKGLDGLAYGDMTDPDEVAAIRWLAANAGPRDRLLEAAGCSYRPFNRLPFSRFSAFTGVPTIIGWGHDHERQWRAGQPDFLKEIDRRERDVAAMYEDPSLPLFDAYGIDWLVVGTYEKENWQAECVAAGPYAIPEGDDLVDHGWQEAFRAGETAILRRGVA